MNKKSKVQHEIEEKFRRLMEMTESNPQLKKEVFNTIDKIENAATIIDLFTIKLVKTETAILEGFGSSNNYNNS